MPPFTVTLTYAKDAVAMANETFVAERPSGDPPGRKGAIILVVVIVSAVAAGVIVFCVYLWVRSRRPSDHERLDDEEPIPLQDLSPHEDGGTIHEAGNNSVSISRPPRRRTLNEYTMALSSNPPSRTDLATAEQTLNQKTMIRKQDVGVPTIIICPPTPVLIVPVPPQPISSQEQSHLSPTRRANSRLGDPRRHSVVFGSDNNQGGFMGDGTFRAQSNLPLLPPAGPGIETMPKVLDEYHQQQQRQTSPSSEFLSPSTITEESTLDITDTPGAESDIELSENVSESYLMTSDSQNLDADNNETGTVTEHDDVLLPPSHEDEHNDNNEVPVQEDQANDADDESDGPISQTANLGASPEGDSRGNSDYSYADEVYDPKDPRYDIQGAVRKFGKKFEPESNSLKAEQTTKTPSDGNNGDSSDNYTFKRDYTNASMVPEPLIFAVRRNNTVHETSSPATASVSVTTAAGQPAPRPASAADVDISPLEPEIETRRPRSFVIREWPPKNNPKPTFDNAPRRQALWYTPPSEEIIERSRRVREQMEWEEEARKVVLQKAKDMEETLSEEEIAKRVRRMYERSSRFLLDSATYQPATPPASPRDTMLAEQTLNGRVRAQRRPRGPHSGNASRRTNRPVSSEPAFASSQALPFAASTTSVIAQDGSRSGSPPAPRRRLRRSNPEHDLSRSS